MKKTVKAIISAAMAFGTALSVVAAESAYKINLNGKTIDADYIKSGEVIMLPVRAVGEALGFKVEWNDGTVSLDNGEVNTTLTIGEDSYYMASSTADGMSSPSPLGAAPEIIGGKTYVPAKLFAVLNCNPESVEIDGNEITIVVNTGTTAATETENVKIPSPFVEYKTVDEAVKALGFTPALPSFLPGGYKADYIGVMDSQMLHIEYTDGKNTLYYRTMKGDGDISGDYNTYDNTQAVKTATAEATLKSNAEKVYSAVWAKDGVAYCIGVDNGLVLDEMVKIIESVK